jgi:hypothetical protein
MKKEKPYKSAEIFKLQRETVNEFKDSMVRIIAATISLGVIMGTIGFIIDHIREL